ncbi:MAG: hypothetical protein ACI8PZ_005048 [Myxococcota bacterium]|jgi:hypothetical protein
MRGMVALVLMACAPGEGVVEVSIWGEDEVTETLQTDDGWTVTVDQWVLAVTAVELGDDKTEETVARSSDAYVVDLAQHDTPVLLTDIPAPAGRLVFGFTIDSPPEDAVVIDDVAGLAEQMTAEGWVHVVRGSATDGTRTVAFDWALDLPARHSNCEDGTDGTAGLAVSADAATQAVLTVHPDHLLWTALGTEEAALGFGAIADADGGDGVVDSDDLRAVSTLDIGYETSGLADTLYDFVAFSVAQAGHLNGDGLCRVR